MILRVFGRSSAFWIYKGIRVLEALGGGFSGAGFGV